MSAFSGPQGRARWLLNATKRAEAHTPRNPPLRQSADAAPGVT